MATTMVLITTMEKEGNAIRHLHDGNCPAMNDANKVHGEGGQHYLHSFLMPVVAFWGLDRLIPALITEV
jgi:hypothetical protein